MLFNGKYYNKPGHLGMTRAELKEALAGGGGDVVFVNAVSADGSTVTVDKNFTEVSELLAAGKSVYLNATVRGITSIYNIDSISESTITFRAYNFQMDVESSPAKLIVLQISIYLDSDNSTSIYAEPPLYASLTPYTP